MSDEMTPARGRLREHVAEEIRVLLARKKMSGAELGRRAGIKQSSISRRLTGETAFDMDDIEKIAEVLEVDVSTLFPREGKEAKRDFDGAPAETIVTKGQGSVPATDRVTRTPDVKSLPRTFVHSKPGTTRPASPVQARKRRPTPIRPTNPAKPR